MASPSMMHELTDSSTTASRERKPVSKVIAVPTDQSGFFAVALGEHPKAVVLDLVNHPARSAVSWRTGASKA